MERQADETAGGGEEARLARSHAIRSGPGWKCGAAAGGAMWCRRGGITHPAQTQPPALKGAPAGHACPPKRRRALPLG